MHSVSHPSVAWLGSCQCWTLRAVADVMFDHRCCVQTAPDVYDSDEDSEEDQYDQQTSHTPAQLSSSRHVMHADYSSAVSAACNVHVAVSRIGRWMIMDRGATQTGDKREHTGRA